MGFWLADFVARRMAQQGREENTLPSKIGGIRRGASHLGKST